MHIVLAGALPDPPYAQELLSHLGDKAPNLLKFLDQTPAYTVAVPPEEAKCTPLEAWLLQQAGFQPQAGQSLSAGWAAWLCETQAAHCNVKPDQPLWLAELVHFAPSRDGAALIPAQELTITDAQSQALFERSEQWFTDTPFRAQPISATHWRIEVPTEFTLSAPTPDLVRQSSINDWWAQDLNTRPWRRLVNEFQMLWFSDPINAQRQDQGLLSINSLWLFGGASRQQFNAAENSPPYTLIRSLEPYAQQQQWGDWLVELQHIEQQFTELIQNNSIQSVVLTGRDRYLWANRTFKPSLWQRWFNRSTTQWRTLWSNP